jgi:hypothetical protein
MQWKIGLYDGLHDTAHICLDEPMQSTYDYIEWYHIRGCKVVAISAYDISDDTYNVRLENQYDFFWVPSDWLEDNRSTHQRWRSNQLSEAKRQLDYAAAFQRLLWREMMGRAAKKNVGDIVKIRQGSTVVKHEFPHAWNEEVHTACRPYGGRIIREVREFGDNGELYRCYCITTISGPQYTLWWTGDDLED